ncbi:hypothetical protein LCGC14_1745430 [marine sediment metagenome]|uniref:Uncharacterized protein n=1 Tax=marine sediment metagenome TaxID=412755 RepID=A0A0F9HT08_9ZZZZ
METEMIRRKLKIDLLKMGGNMEVVARKGDIVDTFENDIGTQVRVGNCDITIWSWELEKTFEDKMT